MHPPVRPIIHHLSQPSARCFSTTTPALAGSTRSALKYFHRDVPPYPYGPSLLYKQSNFGLYGGARPQFGNKVSERNEIKTRRKWVPNIHEKRLWSAAMNRYVRVKVQARVLRTIDKEGGLDEYLMGDSHARIKELGMKGWRMRWRLMQTGWWKERVKRRRIELGLRPEGVEMVLSDAELLGEEEVDEVEQAKDEEKREEGREEKREEGREEEREEEREDNGPEEVRNMDEETDRVVESDPQTRTDPQMAHESAQTEAPIQETQEQREGAAKPRRSIWRRLLGR
ncbi:MAG: hypothetical protein LQ345_003810 [Seirophora villosa]|nr:MAG: hypothetical protein LQ345_003810 [Seirophora villosa]